MMFFGRMVGWLMVIAGAGILVRYLNEWAAAGRALPNAISDLWSPDYLMGAYSSGTALEKMSAVIMSGPAAALLILFGMVLVWGCRTGPLR